MSDPSTFEALWEECRDPTDRDDGERRDLADLFWRSGEAAAQERIRLELLVEAAGDATAATSLLGGPGATRYEGRAAALRDFARRLEVLDRAELREASLADQVGGRGPGSAASGKVEVP